MFVNNRDISKRSKLSAKIESLLKNRSFSQKSKVCSKNGSFSQKSKFSRKIESILKNRSFSQKSNFFPKKSNLKIRRFCLNTLIMFLWFNFGRISNSRGRNFWTKSSGAFLLSIHFMAQLWRKLVLYADRTFEYAPSPMRFKSSYPRGFKILSSVIFELFVENLGGRNFRVALTNLWWYSNDYEKYFVKNQNVGQNSKCWKKIKILVKNKNYGQNSKCSSKIKILLRNKNFGENKNFAVNKKFGKNKNLGEK